MDYKGLLDVSNFSIAAIIRSIYKMGLTGELITTQVTDEYAADDILELLHDSKLTVEGSNPDEVTQSFMELMNTLGAVRSVGFPSVTEDVIEVSLQDCVFNTATKLIRKSSPNEIPVCTWISILSAAIYKSTNKTLTVSKYEWDEATNTCKFKLTME
ncbi:MAG: hypothetical protein K9W43_13210 [Candidatus Thorarchaeota archaeon]|nr:hypothetical protein [Candidatus Thorarchaeota archaeon]